LEGGATTAAAAATTKTGHAVVSRQQKQIFITGFLLEKYLNRKKTKKIKK
jgi:hypothetical protein